MGQVFFITATGTGIGKTFVTTLLVSNMIEQGKKVHAIKPIISGFDYKDAENDTALILRSLGYEYSPENIEKISPWRFSAPLSPDMAARMAGREISFADVVEFCRTEAQEDRILLIEGAGGVMVPLGEGRTIRDLAAELDAKIILVAGSYLGAISHTLSAISALIEKGGRLHSLIISESEDSTVPMEEMLKSIRPFLPPALSVFVLPRSENISEIKPLLQGII